MLSFDTSGAAEACFAFIGATLGSVWVTLSLRLWIRIRRSFTWDDGVCLFSAVSDPPEASISHIGSRGLVLQAPFCQERLATIARTLLAVLRQGSNVDV